MRKTVAVAALSLGVLAALALSTTPALANWVASGTFLYQDREQDQTGFTGITSTKPIRFADVEIRDPNKSGAKGLLATGKTDANGAFSIAVTDSSTRTVRVRVLSTSTKTTDLFVKVTNQSGNTYAGEGPDVAGHAPNVNVNWGTLTAQAFSGAEVFNIFDQAVYGADYVKALTGSRPNSSKLVTFKWASAGGVTVSYTSGNTVTLRDNAGYDDTVILHEWAHYVMNNYSKSSNPGGTHYLSNCSEDVRLAFDEGRASSFGCSVRRYFGMPAANIYMKTDGAAGPGHISNSYDLEDAVQYPCLGDTSEVSVSRTIWDILDGASTTDLTPGIEDTQDLLSLPDVDVWQVYTGPIKSATYVIDEAFWDGWFDPTVANGYKAEMTAIFDFYQIEFHEDAYEPNNATSQATPLGVNGPDLHLTYFYDPGGDGKGETDTDLFYFDAVGSTLYTVQTLNLLSDANTFLEILDTNGSTVLASNDNRASGDTSSLVSWTAPRSDRFYVRSKHATGTYGKYGSYDLRLTTP